MMARSYTTPTRDKTTIPFDLDGRTIMFTAPKMAPMLLDLADLDVSNPDAAGLASMTGLLDWLGAGMSDEDGQWIVDRLHDHEDDFDIDDAMNVANYLLEESTGRPTRPRGGSSAQRNGRTTSTGGRHHKPSTPTISTSGEDAISSGTGSPETPPRTNEPNSPLGYPDR